MDLVMGQFADANLPAMGEDELDEFERLLDVPDPRCSRGSPARRERRPSSTRLCSRA